MTSVARAFACCLAVAMLASAEPVLAAEARLGLGIEVQGEGFFLNPVVTRILVTSVEPSSLAASAGIVKGDEITSVQGEAVKGRRANELKGTMNFGKGETRVLGVKHANGTTMEATITKPKD